jgi:hypothetical protein
MPIPPSADVAFRLAANAAAAAYAQAPAYIAYRTDTTVDVPSLRRRQTIARAVESRTRDDFAVLQDLPQGQRQYAHSFPLIPTFDALSYFRIEYNGSRRDALSYVHQVQPLTYADPRASSHADVVVTSLRYYHAAYLPDSKETLLHVGMAPLPTLTRGNASDFYLHDVYINPATMLPTRVTYTGPDTDFTCDYGMVQDHWLVTHAWYAHTVYTPLRIGRVRFTVDATFGDFRFPATPDDPKLAG